MAKSKEVGETDERPVAAMKPLLLGTKDVCVLVALSRATLRRMVSAGEFPQPIHVGIGISRRSLRWRLVDVRAWVDALKPTSDRETGPGQGKRPKGT